MERISIGCNCHPAYWLRKTGKSRSSYPFDWLLMRRPESGIDYVLQVVERGFCDFMTDVVINGRGHPVAGHYPMVEFFHHHALLSQSAAEAKAEREKLIRRSQRFLLALERDVEFVYCYPIDSRAAGLAAIGGFSSSIDRFLERWEKPRLLVYLMASDSLQFKQVNLEPRNRLTVRHYVRDELLDKTWGGEPEFFR